MDSKIKASFIPDKGLSERSGGARTSSGGGLGDILMLLAVVVLAAVLALAAGVYLYDRFLETSVTKKSEQLTRAREAFDPILIKDLIRLDARLSAASDILARHLAPSEVFTLLQSLTLQSVSYKSMAYTIGDDGVIRINMLGTAQSVNGVALQSSLFGEHNAIISPIFSELNIANTGVTFSVAAILDPLALQYALVAQKRAAAATGVDTEPDTQQQDADDFGDFGAGVDPADLQAPADGTQQ